MPTGPAVSTPNASGTTPDRTRPASGESVVDTVRRLASAQKPPAQGSPAYSRFINRKIGRVLAALSFHARLTPNQVTAISAVFSAVGIALLALARPSVTTGVLVAVLLLVGYAWDSADGQLARLRGGGSPAGEWLDHVVDSVKTSALHLAVLIGWYRFWDLDDRVLLIPIAFTLAGAVFFFVQILTDQLRRAHPTQAPAPADNSWRSVLRSLAVWPTDYGVLCLTFLIWGRHEGFAVVYAVMLAGTVGFMLLALPKWFREAGTFGTAS